MHGSIVRDFGFILVVVPYCCQELRLWLSSYSNCMLHFVHCLKVCVFFHGVSEHGPTSVFKDCFSLPRQNFHLFMLSLAILVKLSISVAAQFKACV